MIDTSTKIEATLGRISSAVERYPGLYAGSGAGVDSAMLASLIRGFRVIHIDTGFLFPETVAFREELGDAFDLDIHVIGPPPRSLVEKILEDRTWETDLPLYRELTKNAPLREAIKSMGITALMFGIRADQTQNRATKDFEGNGPQGERRIHPLLDWTQVEVDSYINTNGLPRHPLYYQGYESIDDWTLTVPAKGRSGRPQECGIHCDIGGVALKIPDDM